MAKRKTPKKLTPQMRLGQEGISMIERTCLKMHCAWNPTGALDVGIDGFIELFDRTSGDALGKHLAVQSKAVSSFANDQGTTFDFACDPRDVAYWRQGNMPVLLIVSCPSTDEMYWISIKDYFEKIERPTNTVRFDKKADRFSEDSYADLLRLGRDESSGLYLGPIPQAERLISNLLPVISIPKRIWVGMSKFPRVQQILPILKASGEVGNDWILRGGSIISFQNLQEYPWSNVCDPGSAEDFGVEEWSESLDVDRQRNFVELLNRTLTTQLAPEVRYRNDQGCYYFAADLETAPRQIRYRSIANNVSMTVVQKYDSTNAEGKTFEWLRHLAFRPQFRRFDETWYLEITPTYLFTWDGQRLYHFHEDSLSKIKQIEKNRSVLSAVALWADYLGNGTPDLFATSKIQFGHLLHFALPVGIDDRGWAAKDPDEPDDESEFLESEDLFPLLLEEESK